MAEIIRVNVVLPYKTGIPRDIAVNVLHFKLPDGATQTDFGYMAAIVEGLYTEDVPDIPNSSLGSYLSPIISREENACAAYAYTRVGSEWVPEPAPFRFTCPSNASGAALPLEVAAALSLTCTPNLNVPPRRRRGRMYLGPLNDRVSGTMMVANTAIPCLSTSFREHAAAICGAAAVGVGTAVWSIYSTVDNAAYEISGGFINNEYDTQRRREIGESVRTTWGAPFP